MGESEGASVVYYFEVKTKKEEIRMSMLKIWLIAKSRTQLYVFICHLFYI